jgi:hypothetical protein
LEQALAKAKAEVLASGITDPEDKDILPVLIETCKKCRALMVAGIIPMLTCTASKLPEGIFHCLNWQCSCGKN